MIEFLTLLKSKVVQWVLAVTGLLTLFGGIYFKGRRDQKEKQILKESTEIKKAQEIRNEVNSLNHTDLTERASRWVR